jgi:predicted permease
MKVPSYVHYAMGRDRLIVVISICVGTALLSSMLAVVFAVMIAPLPFPDSNRIATVATVQDASPLSTSFLDYRDLSVNRGPLAASVYVELLTPATEIYGHSNSLHNFRFEGDLWSVFQKAPVLGDPRDLNSHKAQDTPTAILSYTAWTRFFGRDPQVLGTLIHIGSQVYQVRAVLPSEYQLILPADIWVATDHLDPGNRGNRDGRIYARLPIGASITSANAFLQIVSDSLQKEAPETNEGITFKTALLKAALPGQSKGLLYLLALGAAVVFCVAYFNVYQLLAARVVGAVSRWSLCLALGASRPRLFRDMLREPLLLSMTGCMAGLFLSVLSIRTLRAFSPADIPRVGDARLVWQVALTLFLLSIVAAVLFTVFMFIRVLSQENTPASLHGAARQGSSIRHAFNAKKQSLLIAQIALSTVLLVCIGMLTVALRHAINAPLGFKPNGISITNLSFKEATNTASGGEYARQLMQIVSGLPGVQEVAIASSAPFQFRSYRAMFTVPKITQVRSKEFQFAAVSPQFFAALHLPLMNGRSFLDTDDSNHPKVAILNQAAAKELFGSQDGLNKQIQEDLADKPILLRVVGIVEDIRQDPTTVIAPPIVYLPLEQTPMSSVSLVILASVIPSNGEIQSRIWSLNANQAVGETTELTSLIDLSLRRIRFLALLMTLFSAITMLLSALGIYATVMQWLSTAQQEIALRLAFGATHSQIHNSVVMRVMLTTGVALGIGLLASLGISTSLKSLLYGVQPELGAVWISAALLLGIVAFVSCYMPALRSKFVSPLQLLRSE